MLLSERILGGIGMFLSAARQAWAYQGTLANLSPETWQGRDQKLGRFVVWASAHGVTDIEAVTVPHIHRFLSELPAEMADSTRNGYARVLRAFMNYCALEELVPERLPRRIQMPKVTLKVIEVFTPDQIKRLLAAAGCEPTPALVARDRAILAVLFDTGIRAGELCDLTLDNVHFTPTETWLQVMGKGRRERQVGLGDRARMELHRYIHRYRDAPEGEPHALLSRYGSPVTRSGLLQLFSRLEAWAGEEHFAGVRCSPHTCRHTMAVNYLAHGGDVYKLSRVLGHSTVKTTELYLRAMQAQTAWQGFSVLDKLTGTRG
jgi:integrase/recombinase XerD